MSDLNQKFERPKDDLDHMAKKAQVTLLYIFLLLHIDNIFLLLTGSPRSNMDSVAGISC